MQAYGTQRPSQIDRAARAWGVHAHSENQLRHKSVDLAYNRLHNAIRTARMCRVRKEMGMAKLVFGMNQSLDGYVDLGAFAPSPTLFRHFIEEAQGQAGSVYGRKMYEISVGIEVRSPSGT
jgi:hypothetical protein